MPTLLIFGVVIAVGFVAWVLGAFVAMLHVGRGGWVDAVGLRWGRYMFAWLLLATILFVAAVVSR